jgi:hypothetical protein
MKLKRQRVRNRIEKMSQPFMDSKEEIRKEAESIFRRWQDEDFDIDYEKARQLTFTVAGSYYDPVQNKFSDVNDQTTDAATHFDNALSAYRSFRGTKYWNQAAVNFCTAYQAMRARNCLRSGSSMKEEVRTRELRIVQLDSDLQAARGRLDDLEGQLKRATDANLKLDQRNSDLQTRLDEIRKEDMKNATSQTSARAKAEGKGSPS